MNILIAEDDPVTLKLLSSRLVAWGHTVHQAADGGIAWQTVCDTPIDIVVSDWMMPELDGLELCRRIRDRETSHYTYVILISAQDSKTDIVHGLQSGVDDYITKPIDLEAFRARIEIGSRIVRLERSLNAKIEIITANHYQTIRMFSQLMEVFDNELGGHCRRTAKMAIDLAERHPGVSQTEIPNLEAAALLHDIGMVGLPKAIMSKRRTEMVDNERELYMSHPALGARIIAEIEIMKPAALIVGMHHEQYNGRGFPDGVAGDGIPIGAQLVSAASIYDNLVHRGGIALEQIAEHFQRIRGYQLSPEIVELVLSINMERLHEKKRRTHEERSLDELQPGMILAANVHMKSGAFVMAGDTELNAYRIDKLNHYHAIGAISDKVLIHKSSARR